TPNRPLDQKPTRRWLLLANRTSKPANTPVTTSATQPSPRRSNRRRNSTIRTAPCAMVPLLGSTAAVGAAVLGAGGYRRSGGFAAHAGGMVFGEHPRHRGGDLLAHRDVQELVRAVGIGVRAEHPGDHELRAGEFFAEHAHERDRAAFA